MNKDPRYEIRTGKFGQYFYDAEQEEDMPLSAVLKVLNDHERARFSACDELCYDEYGRQSCNWRSSLDSDYIKRLLDVGRQTKKIPWSCSMYHQMAVAQILRDKGITEEMTMEETIAFMAILKERQQ
jgi:hypothetical protein